ncbi:MAG: VOC family protein [Candidatus Binatia bacterium]|nr:VOC family protein [Candidatus Binatia bacterium]
MILGVHHPALAVPNIKQALDFYCGVVGFKVVMDVDLPSGFEAMSTALGLADGGCAIRMLRKGGSCLELFEFKESQAGDPARPVNREGLTHFALATDDFQADYDHLTSNGVKWNAEPFGQPPLRFAYGRDPFGNVFELLEQRTEGPTSLRFED